MVELDSELIEKLNELAEEGNELADNDKYDEAISVWSEALKLIPEEGQQVCAEAVWFFACIGDMYFQKEMFKEAFDNFDKAVKNISGEGTTNPFVLLRLGECYLELGDEANAKEYLLKAYMMEGKEIFIDDEDEEDTENLKYFQFLKNNVDDIE